MGMVDPVVKGYLSGFRRQIDAAYPVDDGSNLNVKYGLRNAEIGRAHV